MGKIKIRADGRLNALANHAFKLEHLPADLMLLRKQTWARAGGFPGDADLDKACKVFNLRLQNTNHNHLVVETAMADYIGTGGNSLKQAFDLRATKEAAGLLHLSFGNNSDSWLFFLFSLSMWHYYFGVNFWRCYVTVWADRFAYSQRLENVIPKQRTVFR
ncbi:MAG: hypothetical protein IPN96_20985 [Anaerolineales bacterium]|nr:hypothetical protein [Anaerolineales bacterium]